MADSPLAPVHSFQRKKVQLHSARREELGGGLGVVLVVLVHQRQDGCQTRRKDEKQHDLPAASPVDRSIAGNVYRPGFSGCFGGWPIVVNNVRASRAQQFSNVTVAQPRRFPFPKRSLDAVLSLFLLLFPGGNLAPGRSCHTHIV